MPYFFSIILMYFLLSWLIKFFQRSNINWNPFSFFRRLKWQTRVGIKPIYNLSKPIEVSAVFMLGIAKLEGEISREQKENILQIFQNEFNLNKDQSQEMFVFATFILKDEYTILSSAAKILKNSSPHFTAEQANALIEELKHISSINQVANKQQKKLLHLVQAGLVNVYKEDQKW